MPAASSSRIFLASRSPRRRELLDQIGVAFDTLLFRTPPREDADVSEAVLPGEDAETYVVRVARAKAEGAIRRIAWRKLRPQPVLSADTTLELDGAVIGKPSDAAHAAEILQRLSGRTHRVLTAVALADETRLEHVLSISTVRFRTLDEDTIRAYIACGECFDKAGAYAIQGRAAAFVAEIGGSYSGIVGLPLYETTALLATFGIAVF